MDNQINPQEPIIPQPEPQIQPPIKPPIEITPEPELQPQPDNSEPVESTPSNEYQQVLNQYATNTEKLPPINTEPVEALKSPEEQLQNLGITVPPKTGSSFFKGLFIIALIIFIFVTAALGLVYYKSQNSSNNSQSNFDTIENTPTPDPSMICFLNDKTFSVGESFLAADGCNTCSCTSELTIVCTEKACELTPTATVSAKKTTPTATPSATKN